MNPSSGAEFFTQLRHPFLPFQTPPNEGIVPDEGRNPDSCAVAAAQESEQFCAIDWARIRAPNQTLSRCSTFRKDICTPL